MTEEQWEEAARIFCIKIGVDPNQMVQDSSCVGGAYVRRPRWMNISDEMQRFEAMSPGYARRTEKRLKANEGVGE